ncbi:MAG: DUF4262 domain-containing protein [Mycobacterium sp.]
MCDHPDKTGQDYLDEVVSELIRAHGWAIQYVQDERMPFAYTIGLARMGLPELLVTGLPPTKAGWVLNGCAEFIVRDDRPWKPGETVSSPFGVAPLRLVEVEHPDVHLPAAVTLQGPIQALQLVWPDSDGHAPWCPEFNEGRGGQAVLGIAPFDDWQEAG